MALDRDAMIRSIYFGYGEKNWSMAGSNNKEWYIPDLVHDDYNPGEAKRLLASLQYKDGDGDGVLEDTRGNPIAFSLKTNADNTTRVAMANFIRDDLAKIGVRMTLAPVDFNTLITNIRADFQYDAILLGLTSGTPPTPGNGQNFWRSSGDVHQWFVKQQKPATSQEARIDELMDQILTHQDRSVQKGAYKEMSTIVNEQNWLIWVPILKAKVPVSDRFGNVQPSALVHRILWNIERVYVKPRES
jgi:peptide/nickel transport system substrate-binding protein